ncbi:MAG: hypothetical protein AAFQ51_09245 [Pseudomonadota bacterium]
MPPSTLTRRAALGAFAATLAVGAGPLPATTDPVARLAALFDPGSVRAVGRAARAAGVAPRLPTDLLDLSREAALTELETRITADFATGRIVRVDGWALSRTEAELYVAVAAQDPLG